MNWRQFWIMLAKAALQVLADELDPAGRKRAPKEDAPEPKQQPRQPPNPQHSAPGAAQAATPQSAESAGWGTGAEPQPVTVLHIETDEGTTVSPLSFVGDQACPPTRVQREHKAGESRRVRRKAQAEPVPAAPRSPEMLACLDRMRARGSGLVPAAPELPAARPRRRRAGVPPGLTHLTLATLNMLTGGEPPMNAATAA